ncbi:MAG: (Fe-S)-binding protein [Deltaproteobacteria bacterium]|nr:(Fe-S)-binding protein [Deltaproteobacteria bacterium]
MADLKQLAGLIKELEDQLVVCMRCGMCQAVCPVFAETGREADVARGKLALLDGLVQELFKDPRGVNDRLMRCLLCGSCSANCPSGVKVLDIFIKARAILTGYLGLPPLKKAIFRGLLVHPGFFDRLLEWGAKLQGLFVKPVDDLLGTSCGRLLSPLGERHFKTLAPTAFHQMVKPMNTRPGASGLKVAFFVGCVIDKVFPPIGKAVLRALEHHGVGVYLPEDFACCGIPALSSGDTVAFERLVRHNLRRFTGQPFDVLITACATCTATIKKLWPLMAGELSPETQDQVAAIAAKTMDVSQFMVDKLGVGVINSAGTDKMVLLTYHDPCHLKKSLGVALQPRILLQANPGVRFQEMVEADRCCGLGGSFNLQHYDLSAAIGKRKRDRIAQSGCGVVATSCPACMLQITDMLSQAGDRVQVKHAIEVYAESLT